MAQQFLAQFKPLSKDHSTLLNIIRALSAFGILFTHTFMIFLLPRYGLFGSFKSFLFSYPQYFAMALIVLSGFCITYSTLHLLKQNNFQLSPTQFLFKRLIRLYPALLLAIAISVFAFLIFTHGCFTCKFHYTPNNVKASFLKTTYLNPKIYFASLFFLHGLFIGHLAPMMNRALWTLSYEFWYYICFMLITLAIINKQRKVGFGLLLLILLYMTWFHQIAFLFLSIVWLSGVFLALSYASNKLFEKDFLPSAVFAILILAILFFIMLHFYGHRVLISSLIYKANLFTEVVLSLILMLLFAIFLQLNIPIRAPILKKFANCSKFSYTLYIIHYPLLLLSFYFTWPIIQYWPTPAIVAFMIPIGLIIILISQKCAIIFENKLLFKKMLAKIFKNDAQTTSLVPEDANL